MRNVQFAALMILPAVLAAQPPLELKTHSGHDPRQFLTAPAHKRRSIEGRHVIVQFANPPAANVLKQLHSRGAQIVQYIPQNAYVVSVRGPVNLSGLSPYWVGELSADDKLSPLLSSNSGNAQSAVIEFYPDVDNNDARAIVVGEGLQIIDNPDLLPQDLLVQGTFSQLTAAAGWDEVSYIFPASDDLVQGIHVNACADALTDQGPIGQAVPIIGGWDGTSQGSVNLSYGFYNVTAQLPADEVQAAIAAALNEWAKYVQVNFTLTNNPAGDRTVGVLFATGNHGDGYPFDGPGGVLAHTFYPVPMNSEPIAGDMHFDDSESWHIGSDTDLYSVALHEAGHALGLGHSDQPGAVMYPYYHMVTGLSQDDITAIQTLYAARTASSGNSGTTNPPPPLIVTVQSPGATTTAAALNLSGMASGGSGAITVSWSAGSGRSGVASGSANWTISGIPLTVGSNTITVTATDSKLGAAAQQLSITRIQPAPSVPVLQITSPVSAGSYVSAFSTLTLTGTASDQSGISTIAWSNSQGGTGVATGTSAWIAGPVTLSSGLNVLAITAYSTSGGTASQTLQVTYVSPAQPSNPSAPSTPAPPVNPAVPSNPQPPSAPQQPANPSSGDTTAPTLTILSPPMTTLTTAATSVSVTGTASDNVAVNSVTWSTAAGSSGTATGTTNWAIPSIPLLQGVNTITISASDPSGNTAWRSLVVTRN